jgi:hypothetical protein
MLLHAEARWPKAVHISLWPYALHTANEIRNSLPGKDDLSPLEKFTTVWVQPRLNTYHVFGCPVYALHNTLQSRNMLRRWEPRARLGLYLGPSPRHARNVSLVLNLNTGLVSPQFHVTHDDFFETTEDHCHQSTSAWQQLTGFTRVAHSNMPPAQGEVTPMMSNTSDDPSQGTAIPNLDNQAHTTAQSPPDIPLRGHLPDISLRSRASPPDIPLRGLPPDVPLRGRMDEHTTSPDNTLRCSSRI